MKMSNMISGKVFTFGKNIDTDQIYPGRFVELTNPADVVKHTMEGADPNFIHEFQAGDIIVAGSNFGCGSSREHAAVCLKEIGVGAVIANSFARIFYRNGINLGIPLIVCPDLSEKVKKGQVISLNIENGEIKDEKGNTLGNAEPLSDYSLTILSHGGIKNMLREQLKE